MSAGRPPGCFLTAQWRHLLMINYAIDPAVLRPLVPPGLALDVYRGEALVSMVGFQFLDTRVLGVPIPFHRRFDEVNLRFYVKRELPGEIRRGVVFVREVVPKRAVALIARRVYNEPYVALPMRSDLRLPSGDRPGLVKYLWRSESRWLQIEASFRGDPAPLREQSEAQFIAEHYWGYGRTRDGRTIESIIQAGTSGRPTTPAWKGTPPGSMARPLARRWRDRRHRRLSPTARRSAYFAELPWNRPSHRLECREGCQATNHGQEWFLASSAFASRPGHRLIDAPPNENP